MKFLGLRFSNHSSPFAQHISNAASKAEDAGTRDGISGTPCDDYASTKVLDLEQVVRAEVTEELGECPDVLELESRERAALEQLAATEDEHGEVLQRPWPLLRRALLGAAAACCVSAVALVEGAAAMLAMPVGVAGGLAMAASARGLRVWRSELTLKQARRRHRACRFALDEASARARRIAARIADRMAHGQSVVTLSYRRGYQKGLRFVELQTRGARDTLPDLEPAAPVALGTPRNGSARDGLHN